MDITSQISKAHLDHVTGGGTPTSAPAATPTSISPGNCGLGGVLHTLDSSIHALNNSNNSGPFGNATTMMMFGMALAASRRPDVVVYNNGPGWGWHRHCW